MSLLWINFFDFDEKNIKNFAVEFFLSGAFFYKIKLIWLDFYLIDLQEYDSRHLKLRIWKFIWWYLIKRK